MEPSDAGEEDARSPRASTCPMCGCDTLTTYHCKTVCSNCGYVESCEDLFEPRDEFREASDDEAAG
ncbi:MAG: hypothetical protein JSV78_12540 [Phycisphaerales bacterium]|nr:MAG: hypothetical protein JSV78_12540 [Phycisphaerales bacterium]